MLNKKTIILFFAGIWTVIITVLSLISLNGIGSSIKIEHKDKYVHFTFYFVFMFLWYFSTKHFLFSNKIKRIILFLAIIYGIFMELCQGWFAVTRTPDIRDVFANSLGALTAFIILHLARK
ncbi:VanZ family protein [Flavobacterium aciduliphilum]|uniref:VanZ like protein n=1 Tax=Flavobacterium aciduliphilum TaxID=1101402 RepID=A0A328YE03_9FLAO|nr:VanZ family protein [Flavobacterium aciduliphilum]RAR71770.1 VanZ like protein [Flavobacterium aciduliphilum]